MPLDADRQAYVQRFERVLQMRRRQRLSGLIEQAQCLLHQRSSLKQAGVLVCAEFLSACVHRMIR